MNVKKVQRLSEQHEALKKFHECSTCNNVSFTIESQACGPQTLSGDLAEVVIITVRKALLEGMQIIEKAIQAETAEV